MKKTEVLSSVFFICLFVAIHISIHALTWSATTTTDRDKAIYPISIHALSWSATLYAILLAVQVVFQSTHSRGVRLATSAISGRERRFQSTHSRGVRLDGVLKFADLSFSISIHALSWSATAKVISCQSNFTVNPFVQSNTTISSIHSNSCIALYLSFLLKNWCEPPRDFMIT